MTKMEGTIGPIASKLDSILEKIDDVKRVKKQKKDAMASFITNIEEDTECMYQIKYHVLYLSYLLPFQWMMRRKVSRYETSPPGWNSSMMFSFIFISLRIRIILWNKMT